MTLIDDSSSRKPVTSSKHLRRYYEFAAHAVEQSTLYLWQIESRSLIVIDLSPARSILAGRSEVIRYR